MNESQSYYKHKVYEPPIYNMPATSTRLKLQWPPSPSCEDEDVSLSREHSPALPELEASEVKMRGSIDQQPILVEVGKEEKEASKSPNEKNKGVKWADSSDDSSGPETPTESTKANFATKSSKSRSKKQDLPPASPSIQDVLNGSLRSGRVPRSPRDERYTEYSNRDLRDLPSRPRKAVHTEYLESPSYPGTLKELRDSPAGQEPLPFAQRHRTMSGSDNAPDHRPHNVRHMSAVGYAGESQTPSFSRDHPIVRGSHLTTEPRSVPPHFQPGKQYRGSAIESDIESSTESSQEEALRKNKTHRNIQDSNRPPLPPRPYKASDHDYAVSQKTPVSGRGSGPMTPLESYRDGYSRAYSEQHGKGENHYPAQASSKSYLSGSTAESPLTPRGSPSSSRPTSREGPLNVVYPNIKRVQTSSRPSSPIPGTPSHSSGPAYFDSQNHGSSLRYPSRPTSPTLHPPADVNSFERQSRGLQETRHGKPSPGHSPDPGRSPRLGLRVDVNSATLDPAPKTWGGPRPEMAQRYASGDLSAPFLAHSPKVPMTAPFWATDIPDKLRRPVDDEPPMSAPPVRKPKFPKGQILLPACPRPGFVTGYDDWWTLPQIPDLDLCPTCMDNLLENGFPGQFVRSEPRPLGFKTRCDMTVPWVRMALLLILQGRAKISLLRDLMSAIGQEDPCPGPDAAVRKKWYRIYDAEADRHVSGFDICPSCVSSIDILFPNLRKGFESAHHISPYSHTVQRPRACGLTLTSPRFARYVDLLEDISTQAYYYRREANMQRFIQLVRTFAEVPSCRRDDQFRGVKWHFIPHLPDFTVCAECYLDVVWPAARSGSEIADSFNRTLQSPPSSTARMSCQLYSPRMRAIFDECCKREDFGALRNHVLARVNKERELQYAVERAQNSSLNWRDVELETDRAVEEWRQWE
jgi:hypothetical protein